MYSSGSITDLGALGPNGGIASDSIAFALNDLGQAVGLSRTNGPGSPVHATLFSAGVVFDLGTFSGDYSVALGINAQADIVGYSYISTGSGPVSHGFLFTGGAMYDLNDLVLPGSGATNIDLSQAGYGNPVNDFGQIVAHATINGQTHAVLLSPLSVPEP